MLETLTGFLALSLGHLLGDFVLQSDKVVAGKTATKRSRRALAHLEHSAIHYLVTLLAITLFTHAPAIALRTQIVLFSLILGHLLIDIIKSAFHRGGKIQSSGQAFLLDQAVHWLTLFIAALFLIGGARENMAEVVQWTRGQGPTLLAVGCTYTGVIFGGGYLIGLLLRPFSEALETQEDAALGRGLAKAGRYIGWLERFLVLTAVLLEWHTTAGLIIAAKSIFRFPELQGEKPVRPFAEYFLIGTLLSLALAVLGGLILRALLGFPMGS